MRLSGRFVKEGPLHNSRAAARYGARGARRTAKAALADEAKATPAVSRAPIIWRALAYAAEVDSSSIAKSPFIFSFRNGATSHA
jgi:hypothetical protein